MANDGIGASVLRKEDKRFITGTGRYTDDVLPAHTAHAVFVRSPHANATIKSVDTRSAAKMPGVIAIHTGEELAAEELRAGAYSLGRLLGRVDVEDILDVIFREFCIGK